MSVIAFYLTSLFFKREFRVIITFVLEVERKNNYFKLFIQTIFVGFRNIIFQNSQIAYVQFAYNVQNWKTAFLENNAYRVRHISLLFFMVIFVQTNYMISCLKHKNRRYSLIQTFFYNFKYQSECLNIYCTNNSVLLQWFLYSFCIFGRRFPIVYPIKKRKKYSSILLISFGKDYVT